MPNCTIAGVQIRGISAAVPETVTGVEHLVARYGQEAAEKMVASSGVVRHRNVKPGQTTADLCELATRALLRDLNWDPKSVDVLLMVSQTFDHYAPATSCILHGKLGLAKTAACFDVSLGCSGWTYALWMGASFLNSGCKRVLILAGDTAGNISPFDNYASLAGDAGTATALERDDVGIFHCDTGSDGTGWKSLWTPAGGFRLRNSEATREFHDCDDGIRRADDHMHMNGPDVFAFTIREVPPMVDRTLALSGWAKADLDAFVLHQANKFMLDYLAKRMKLPTNKVPFSLQEFGNTSSASIPLTIQHALRGRLRGGRMKLLLAGFGVGLSWGAVAAEVGPLVIPELQILP
jgi:3-oxoacyl-[acyl-carrier-protein] synthase-3